MAAESSGRPFKNLGGGRIVKRKTDIEKVWSIRDIPVRFDWVKPAKEVRAKRRVENDTVEGGDGEWCVWGMPELSDSFEKYSVSKDFDTGNLSCSCQSHAHGDARGFCSHQLAVALYEHRKDPYPRFEALDWSHVFGGEGDMVTSSGITADPEPTDPYNHEEEMRSIIKEISVPEPASLWSVEGVIEWRKTRAGELSSVPACASTASLAPTESLVKEFIQSIREAPEHEEAQSSQFWYDYEKTPTILTLTEIAPNRWSLPEKFSEIRPNQLIGLKQIVAQWHDRKKFILVDAPTGCLSASTWIKYAIYDSEGKRYSHRGSSIERLYKRFHRIRDVRQRGRDPIIPDNHELRVASVYPDGRIRTNKIIDVIYNGKRECFRVKTCNGYIKATSNHPFLTSRGYVNLSDLKVGDMVLVHRNARECNGREKRKLRIYLFVKNHPIAGIKIVDKYKYHRLARSRATVEANMNGMSLKEYVSALNSDNQIPMSFLTRDFDVHHIDENVTNDELSNLCVLDKKDHSKMHEERDKLKILRVPVEERILSITSCGIDDVYDLTMQDVPNFSANDFFVHNSGKTALGIIAAMEISGFADGNKKVESLYICTDRALQDQFWDDFEFCLWSAILKGRRNYPTANYASKWQEENPSQTQWEREQVVSCEDCEYSQKKHCSLCDPRGYVHSEGESPGRGGAPCLGRCPYRQAVRKLVHSDVGNMNTAYLLRACSGPSWGQYNKKKVLIVDEADCLESAIMGYVEISVSEFKLRRLGMGRPKKKTVVSSWIEWAEEAINKIGFILDLRSRQLDNPTDKSLFGEDEKLFGNDKLLRRDSNSWISLCDQLQLMYRSLQGGKDPWVYDTDENKEGEEIGPVVFKPVIISAFVENMLWKHFDFVMLMSATLICPFQTAEDLGIPAGNFGAVCLPSSFDPKRSPVYVYPVADNSFKMQEQNYPILLGEIIKAVNLRPKVRILIHAVSYKQADKLVRDLNRLVKGRAVIGHERGVASKNKAKAEYRLRPNSIMVSPSMARGENLYDDLLRFQIIMKMPFGNLGDKQISQRLYGTTGGKRWYLINTIRETVQMEGRGMRHANDWAETLILDAKFISVWQEGAELFPKYFRDRMVFIQEGRLVEYMQNGFGDNLK